MRLWISTVVAAIALAGPAWAGDDAVSGAEARGAVKARVEQEHAHRTALAQATAEHQAAMGQELLRATAATVPPPMDASQLAAELRPLLPGQPALPTIGMVADR